MKILLMNDTTRWYHFGCTATSTALIEGIIKLGHTITPIPITETYKIKSPPVTKEEFISSQTLKQFISNNPNLIDLIKEHDAVIFNGEGTLHGLNSAPAALLYIAYISKKEFKKHVEILNHSAYPQHNKLIGNSQEAAIYKLVYEYLDFVAIREPISFNTMKKLNVNVTESFDCMPIYIRDHYTKSNVKHDKELLIAGSATWLQLNLLSKQRRNIEDLNLSLSDFNRYLTTMFSKGFNIKFLYGAEAYPAKDDREFLEYMKNQFALKCQVYEATSLNDWLKTIEESTILVSGRFHHTIAAACLGTTFITFNSNTPKMEGLIKALGTGKVLKYDDQKLYSKLISLTNQKLSLSSDKTDFPQSNIDFNNLCSEAEKNFEGLKTTYKHQI